MGVHGKREVLHGSRRAAGSFNLPSDNCYSSALNPANKNFSRCRRTGYEVPLTTTQVKFTWTVSVQVGGIWLPIWTTTKQVSLT